MSYEVKITVRFPSEEAARRFGEEAFRLLEERVGSDEEPLSVDYQADLPSTGK